MLDMSAEMKKVTLVDKMIFDNKCRLHLEIYYNRAIIGGNSGVGKSYLFNILKSLRDYGGLPDNLIFINYDNKQDAKHLGEVKHKIIFIDNADLVLSNKDRERIMLDDDNYYVLFGRNLTGFGNNIYTSGLLVINNNEIKFDFPLARL